MAQERTDLVEFEHEEYMRCSDNNMPSFVAFVPLSPEEQRQADEALALA
ncbi:hypothetical protein [Gandjariella thermophila]|uniref:Uncharacterized protein n=1 Tax=Gandjariella thermophila TaxID=1931992 RepID=A0A4D4JAL2_9PSEU|nr:hypothetical protein [Gandjariella thermophila]GDY33855.1 hypothetical protein GTS_54880 [Gandjariella thermophila]